MVDHLILLLLKWSRAKSCHFSGGKFLKFFRINAKSYHSFTKELLLQSSNFLTLALASAVRIFRLRVVPIHHASITSTALFRFFVKFRFSKIFRHQVCMIKAQSDRPGGYFWCKLENSIDLIFITKWNCFLRFPADSGRLKVSPSKFACASNSVDFSKFEKFFIVIIGSSEVGESVHVKFSFLRKGHTILCSSKLLYVTSNLARKQDLISVKFVIELFAALRDIRHLVPFGESTRKFSDMFKWRSRGKSSEISLIDISL